MKTEQSSNSIPIDDQLAEFTDRARSEQTGSTEPGANAELMQLEELVLRLNKAFPRSEVDKISLKRIQSNLRAKWQSAGQAAKLPAWRKWLGTGWGTRASRQRLALALVIGMVVILALTISPLLYTNQTDTTASAISTAQVVSAVAILAGIILAIMWLNNRR